MESKFIPSLFEEKLYAFWEKAGLTTANVNPHKKPFSIILPPPNANGYLHLGHAMFVYEDIMIRFQKMSGKETLWLLGLDHAGFETQYVFEKHLKKQGKSRFNYGREELFKMIWDFVMESKSNIKSQLRRLGFVLDWRREKFTMDDQIVTIVHNTFKKLYDTGLLYRAERLVNYCTSCGTSFSDLEVDYQERIDPLYYMKYGPFTLATVRPETKFGDTAVAVHPNDKRYQKWIGKEIEVEGLVGSFKLKVVADFAVDPKFGTGAVKVTPSHDFTDYEIAQRHHLPLKQVIGFNGKLNELAGKYSGLKVMEARQQVAVDLKEKGLLVKVKEDYKHRVGMCYRCGRALEPLPKEQWFIKIRPLADKAKELVEKGKIEVYPKKFTKRLLSILDNFIDWNISRQVVWGIRIPAYQCMKSRITNNKSQTNSKSQIQNFKQDWFISVEKPTKCQICGNCKFEQDPDTFDTWFSSAQWPFATLMTEGKKFLDYFYPTSVMETGHDILRAWVARMIMIGHFVTNKVPFKKVFLHGMVRDVKGKKMSKSKGNVIDPLVMVDKYGADSLRAALIFGTKEGGDVVLSEQKIIAMRNFANKIWNIGRFIQMNQSQNSRPKVDRPLVEKVIIQNENPKSKILKELKKEVTTLKKKYIKLMEGYKFSKAFDELYHFLWHRFADYYIEELKEELQNGNMEAFTGVQDAYLTNLQMLHPFIPFVTDAVWQVMKGETTSILQTNY